MVNNFTKGEQVIMGVAPGWLFLGRVEFEDEKQVVLNPCVWLEGAKNPQLELTNQGVRPDQVVGSNTPMGTPMRVQKHAILWTAETAVGPEVFSPQANALRGVK